MCGFELRPHHGLCTMFFEGRGYSPEFTEHMGQAVEELKGGARVILTLGHDRICEKCPHRLDGKCEEKAGAYDRRVMRLCGLEGGQGIESAELYRLIGERILEKGYLAQVCGDCQWAEICERKIKGLPRK